MYIGDKIKRVLVFIRYYMNQVSSDSKCVLGLSGGIDSTVMAYLLKAAVGAERMITVSLPAFPNLQSTSTATAISNAIGSTHGIINIGPIIKSFNIDDEHYYRLGNLAARIRMTILYDIAGANQGLVVNTCNLSEDTVGYCTKFGDSAGDFAPIAHLTKQEIYEFAEFLKIPEEFINRIPSAELWANQTDEGELGFSYVFLDSLIKGAELEKMDFATYLKGKISELYNDITAHEKVLKAYESSRHKFYPMPSLVEKE